MGDHGGGLGPAEALDQADGEESDIASTGDGNVIIMIQDTGIGIASSEQKAIFERFYMVGDPAYHSSSKTAFGGGGIGLGLPIARGIIEAHGGRIWVESKGRNVKTNPGSAFYILLPVTASKR